MATDQATYFILPAVESLASSSPETEEHNNGNDRTFASERNEEDCFAALLAKNNDKQNELMTFADMIVSESSSDSSNHGTLTDILCNGRLSENGDNLSDSNSSSIMHIPVSEDGVISSEQNIISSTSSHTDAIKCDAQVLVRNDSESSIPDEAVSGTSRAATSDQTNLASCAAATRKSKRSRKRSHPEDVVICPTCGLSIKSSLLQHHLECEIQKLHKISKRKSYEAPKKPVIKPHISPEGTDEVMDAKTRYKQYLTIRTRRERRSRASKKAQVAGSDETTCPVCNEVIVGTEEQLAEHVDQCLIRQEAESDAELDIEGDDTYEEYTWAGQTRIRATTLMEGGPAAAGLTVHKRSAGDEDENIDLDIDGDDCNMYGKPQYTEADLIPCAEEENQDEKERKALRKAVLRGEGAKPTKLPPSDRQRWQHDTKICDDKRIQKACEDERDSSNLTEIMESLKAKIKEQETQLQKIERPKCLICMDWYTKPLTSVQCWHVHCEECWLRTLGTKKLCPQCNMITSPVDLRRIYL